jgi:uncharacterized protein (DUF2141 family)
MLLIYNNSMKKKLLSYVLVCLVSIPCVASADTFLLTVNGVKAGQGNLRIAVFDEAHREDFPDGEYLLGVVVAATEEGMTVEISNLESGEYAIAVIQDLNENGKLDKNFLGIPKEPYGFSGQWKSGSSSFDKALFNTDELGFATTITLK